MEGKDKFVSSRASSSNKPFSRSSLLPRTRNHSSLSFTNQSDAQLSTLTRPNYLHTKTSFSVAQDSIIPNPNKETDSAQSFQNKSKMSFFSSKKKKESVTVTPSANPAVLSSLNSSINGQNANSTLTNNPSASNSYSRTQRLENTVPNANAPTVHSTNPTLNASTGPVNANVNAPSGIAPPAPSSNISYPWSLRPLHLLPPSPAPPDLSENKTSSLSQLNTLASPSPFPRYGHSVNPLASSPSGELYIFGGLINEQVKSDLYVLQCPPNTPQSTGAGPPGTLSVALVETKGETPGARVGHASVGVGNVLIIWGGDTKTAPEDIQDDGLYLLNLSKLAVISI